MKTSKTATDSANSALLLDAALESIPYGFCIWNDEFRLVMWNEHYRDVYGFPRARLRKGMSLDAIGKLAGELGHHGDKGARGFIPAYKAALLANREGARAVMREKLAGGRTIETAHVYAPGLGWVVTHEDVTAEIAAAAGEQKRRRELERQNLRLDATVNNISQGLCMFDARGRLVICNAPYARIYDLPERLLKTGTRLEEILGHLFDHGMSTDGDREAYVSWRRDVIARGEYGKNLHELNGRMIMMQHHPMADGGWVSTHEDITEQRQQEARIQHLARHDALTELPNRNQFLEQLAAAEPSLERGEKAAVLHIDLNDFRAVNETLGYAVGDNVLKQASARLWGTTRETDVLARLGGDEFALLLRPVHKPADAAAIADRIARLMDAPLGLCSRPGQGTTFWLRLPRAVAARRDEAPVVRPGLGGARILIVDNDPAALAALGEPGHHYMAFAQIELGWLDLADGSVDQAARAFASGRAALAPEDAAPHPRSGDAQLGQLLLLQRSGDADAAAALLAEVIALRRQAFGPGHAYVVLLEDLQLGTPSRLPPQPPAVEALHETRRLRRALQALAAEPAAG